MTFLIVALYCIGYLVFGWLFILVATMVSPVWRKAFANDTPPIDIAIVLWPFAMAFAPIYFLSQFLNPVDFADGMEKRRKARKNVIVKPRRFRGRKDD